MGMLAWIFGFLGMLGMVMGIVTALEVAPMLTEQLTWLFWFLVSGLLLLICIAFAVGRGGGYEE